MTKGVFPVPPATMLPSTIKEALYDIAADLEDAPIIISADEETPYQIVIRIMDAARQLGLIKITFATRINEEDY